MIILILLIGACADGEDIPVDEVQEVRGVESVPVDPGLLSALQRAEVVDVLPTATPDPPAPVTPAPTPGPTPAPERPAVEPAENVPVAGSGTPRLEHTPSPLPEGLALPESVAAFLAGYRFGGGDPAWEGHWVNDVIPCESEWDVDPPGIHYGLAQFAEGTWHSAKCSPEADYTDPWEQGCAVARWMAQIPGRWGTSAGWPNCFWR